MNLTNFIMNRLLQFAQISQLTSVSISFSVVVGNISYGYQLSAYTINQDRTVTIQFSYTGQIVVSSVSNGIIITISATTASGTTTIFYTFATDSVKGFSPPKSIVITIKPGNVYSM